MSAVRVQTDDFDAGFEADALARQSGEIGAVVTFTGMVRGDDGLSALRLEHYPGMTEREITRHVADAESRWPLLGVTVIHRFGRLVPGDRIVLVAVASAHRAAAFEATAFLMDYLKTRAPFWKLEERGDALTWVEAKSVDDQAALRWR
jgi:molybdopterin synthase catalytic subunit